MIVTYVGQGQRPTAAYLRVLLVGSRLALCLYLVVNAMSLFEQWGEAVPWLFLIPSFGLNIYLVNRPPRHAFVRGGLTLLGSAGAVPSLAWFWLVMTTAACRFGFVPNGAVWAPLFAHLGLDIGSSTRPRQCHVSERSTDVDKRHQRWATTAVKTRPQSDRHEGAAAHIAKTAQETRQDGAKKRQDIDDGLSAIHAGLEL